jgi:hypothetical protein
MYYRHIRVGIDNKHRVCVAVGSSRPSNAVVFIAFAQLSDGAGQVPVLYYCLEATESRPMSIQCQRLAIPSLESFDIRNRYYIRYRAVATRLALRFSFFLLHSSFFIPHWLGRLAALTAFRLCTSVDLLWTRLTLRIRI